MSMELGERSETRKSLPLSAADLRDLQLLRSQKGYEHRSEASLMSEVFRRGMQAVREEALEQGYRAVAQQYDAEQSERQSVARRRRPAWAEEQ
ncbi:hypothetical protein [Luteococcus sp.]|uniref:hypothetical protein n=1 Tax=Luteococcus sp. TaxID=1969402 RepID=UPI0037363A3F